MALRLALRILAGLAVAFIGSSLIGLLELQRIATESGAVFDLNNMLTAITEPETPVIQMMGLAACGAIILLFITWDIRGSLREGSGAGTIALIVVLVGIIAYFGITADYIEEMSRPPFPGLEGWLYKAAYHPLIHTAIIYGILAPLVVRQRGNKFPEPVNPTTPEQS